jgi:hypothetical protein
VPGDVQCQWCKAKTVCVEYQRFAGAMVPGVLTLLEVPVSQWTPQQRAIFMDKRKAAQAWLDMVEGEMRKLYAADPEAVPGWLISPPAKIEKIANPQAAWERFLALGGSMEAFMGTVTVGKVKLKEALHAATGKRGKELDATLSAICQGIVEVSERSGSWKRLAGNQEAKE